MKSHRIGVRVSAQLYELLAAAGDVSAATRALAILGAAAAGYESSVCCATRPLRCLPRRSIRPCE